MTRQIVHVLADDGNAALQDAVQGLARAQAQAGAHVIVVLPAMEAPPQDQGEPWQPVIVAAPGDAEIEALTDAADIVHVHGAGQIFHRFAKASVKGACKLVADIRADSAEWLAAANHKVADRALRFSMRAYGFVAVSGTSDVSYVPRDWGLSFFETPEAGRAAAQSAYSTVTGQSFRSILGLKIEIADEHSAIRRLDERIAEGKPTKIGFVNANLALQSLPHLAAMEDFVLFNDGLGINLASKLLYGSAFPRNLNGTDFVPRYLTESRNRLRIFLLGAKPDVLERVQDVFAKRWPWHEVVGVQDGYFPREKSDEVAQAIAATKADLVLVAMGNPRQEMWTAKYIPAAAPAAICVGALFDFLAGEVVRAPLWVRNASLEWAWRLMQEPRRLARRYLVESFFFFWHIFGQMISGARAGRPSNVRLVSGWRLIGAMMHNLLMPEKKRSAVYGTLSAPLQYRPVQRALAMTHANQENANEGFVGDYFGTIARFLDPNLPLPPVVEDNVVAGTTRWSIGQTLAFGTVASICLWAALFGIFHFVA